MFRVCLTRSPPPPVTPRAPPQDHQNWFQFSVDIQGPDEYDPSASADGAAPRPSPYRDGLFRVELHFTDSFPETPPSVKFLHRVWHPLVSDDAEHVGKLCEDFMKEQWTRFKPPSPAGTVKDVLLAVRGLLKSPHINVDLFVNGEAREQLKNMDDFDAKAAAYTAKYAGQ